MEAVAVAVGVMVVHEWEHASGYIPKEYQTRIRTNLHVHIARDCHPLTCYRTVLLYMCYSLVICTLVLLGNPLAHCPVGFCKRFPANCTLESNITLMLIPPQITEVGKFFSTTLAGAWRDVSICQMHQPADPA